MQIPNISIIAKTHLLKNTISESTKMFSIIIIDGMPNIYSQSIPVLSAKTFEEICKSENNNIAQVVKKIESKSFLADMPDEYMRSFYTMDYRNSKFDIPISIIKSKVGRNDPCPCGARKYDGNRVIYKNCCERTY